MRYLFVCTGNICRSPSADGVMRHKLDGAGILKNCEVDSAGTHAYHVGEPPDARSRQHAHKRGYELSHLRARAVIPEDFDRFDRLLAMDSGHLEHLQRMAPADKAHKAQLFLEAAGITHTRDVPDPYYHNAKMFEQVLDLVEEGCEALLRKHHTKT